MPWRRPLAPGHLGNQIVLCWFFAVVAQIVALAAEGHQVVRMINPRAAAHAPAIPIMVRVHHAGGPTPLAPETQAERKQKIIVN